jgi:hypothetical protein
MNSWVLRLCFDLKVVLDEKDGTWLSSVPKSGSTPVSPHSSSMDTGIGAGQGEVVPQLTELTSAAKNMTFATTPFRPATPK